MKKILMTTVVLMMLPKMAMADLAEDYFNHAKRTVSEMNKRNELDGQTPWQVLAKYLRKSELFLECRDWSFEQLDYYDCVTTPMTQNTGLQERVGDMIIGVAISRYGERILDTVERGVAAGFREARAATERSMREDQRRRDEERRRTERDERCAFSASSLNTSDC